MAAPTDIQLSVSPATVDENAAVDTIIATITGTDADTAASGLTFSLVNNAGGRFKIITSGSNKYLAVNNSVLLDADQQSLHEVIIRVSDGSGTYDESFSIAVNDLSGETVTGSAGADTIVADDSSGNSSLSGGLGNDTITGGTGNDTLVGGGDIDSMKGGQGNDSYSVDSASDYVMDEFFNGGTDTVTSSVNYALQFLDGTTLKSRWVENLILTGTATDGTGNSSRNMITGNGNANKLDGGTSGDTLIGSTGNDTYYVDDDEDVVVEAVGEGTDKVIASASYSLTSSNVTYPLREVEILELKAGSSARDATGNALNNTIIGNAVGNKIDGKGGADAMTGGDGSDTYVIDDGGDTVTEASGTTAGAGDEVWTTITYTLGANLEKLKLLGTDNISGTGNSQNNTVTGNSGNNSLSGGDGVDTLVGGLGNDTYILDSATEKITELANQGTDIIRAGFTISLASVNYVNVEKIALQGTGNFNATGSTAANTLIGNSGNNKLDGGAGNDVLDGGTGDDTYVVDVAADSIIEAASAGTDTVESKVAYTLAADLENLTLTGTSNISGTGNASANVIIGNGGANALDGSTGADTLRGGLGNDTYTIDSSDIIEETTGHGTDTIMASFSYALSNDTMTGGKGFFENLTLTGSAVNGTGNNLGNKIVGNASNNVLTGNGGADWLEGGSGDDTMNGGIGNDTYVINGGDTVQETMTGTTGGYDTIRSAVGYTLGANVEHLVLTGTADNGTGNAYGNNITGNGSDNVLRGMDGGDTINGGAGNDELWGGVSKDFFVFNTALNASTNLDTIKDYSTADDNIWLDNAIFTALAEGTLDVGAFHIGTAATDAFDRIIYNSTTGEVSYDADGNGATAAIKFAKVAVGVSLNNLEFTVV
jgi:Ca2+-binding RTX toxin-like protein